MNTKRNQKCVKVVPKERRLSLFVVWWYTALAALDAAGQPADGPVPFKLDWDTA